MEELLLGRFFARHKLDIVHQENIYITVFIAKINHRLLPNGRDEVIGKGLDVT